MFDIPGLDGIAYTARIGNEAGILEMLDFLPRHRIGNDVPRLHQLVRQAFTERARHQARDHVGTRHGDDEREKKIRQNNFETNAHRGLFFSDRGPLILL